jgi:hypothetical protein
MVHSFLVDTALGRNDIDILHGEFARISESDARTKTEKQLRYTVDDPAPQIAVARPGQVVRKPEAISGRKLMVWMMK